MAEFVHGKNIIYTYVQLYNVIQKVLKILLYEKHRTELKSWQI